MKDQPIIIEQSSEEIKMQEFQNQHRHQGNSFYDLLDHLESYDHQVSQLKLIHQQAMIALANIRFANPLTPINPHGLQCLPAFLTLTPLQTQKSLFIQFGYGKFSQQIKEHEDPEAFQEQTQIEFDCQSRNLEKINDQQIVPEKLEQFKEGQTLRRFNVLSQSREVLAASHIFQQLLQKIFEVESKREELSRAMNQMETKNEDKNKD